MKYTKKDQHNLRKLLYEIYPELDSFSPNNMIPAVFKAQVDTQVDGNIRVILLAYAEKKFFKHISRSKNFEDEITITAQPNKDNIGEDLVIKLDLTSKLGQSTFLSVASGSYPMYQKGFIQTLKEVNEIYVWLVTYPKKEIIGVLKIPFNHEDHKEIFDRLLDGAEVQID